MKNRILRKTIQEKLLKKTGRILVLTGARQTGKTTLAKHITDTYEYVSFDDPVLRDSWAELSAEEWHKRYPMAVLDEVQKTPSVIESVKAVYEKYNDARYILIGSSQILLLKQVRESLAGRVSLFELFPLTLPEARSVNWEKEIQPSLFYQLINKTISIQEIIQEKPVLDESFADKMIAWNNYLEFGHMPLMSDPELDNGEKRDWLKDYTLTYLQRDLGDLARINDLDAFGKVQRQCALLTGRIINFSQLASLGSVSANTARKFVNYLELSYQTVLLPPWTRNELKRMVKSPKLHMIDPGICRALSGHYSRLDGFEFESAVVSELYKQLKSWRLPGNLYHLRTSDGREVDALLETDDGYYAFEIKMTKTFRKPDARCLRDLELILDKPLLAGIVLSEDRKIHALAENMAAVPAAWFLG